jgi:RsiW-degrading membrane proteinase PrsW (M82 family)
VDFSSPSFLITFAVMQTVVFLLLIRLVDLYEHEPFPMVAAMAAWGAIGATAISLAAGEAVRSTLSPDVRTVFGAAISAPVVEELSKGVALLAVFAATAWAHNRYGSNRLSGVTDGLVYGAAVGLGFAFTEDLHFLVTSADLSAGFDVYLARRGLLGVGMLRHAVFTAAFGAGLGLATLQRSWIKRVAYALAGVMLALLLHGLNNGLVNALMVRKNGLEKTARAIRDGALGRLDPSTFDLAGRLTRLIDYLVIVGFTLAIAGWLAFQRKIIREELPEEAESGLIDDRDWELVPRYWERLSWYWQLIRVGEIDRARIARRLHVELANLAFLKHQHKGAVDKGKEVARSRQRVANLKAAQSVDVYAPGSIV